MSARNRTSYFRKALVIAAVAISISAFLAYAVFFNVTLTDIVLILDDASLRQTAKDNLTPTDNAYPNNQNAADSLLPADDTYQNNQNAADSMGFADSVQPSSQTVDALPLTDFVTRNFFVIAIENIGLADQISSEAETPEPPESHGSDEDRYRGGSGGPDRSVYDESYFIKNPLKRLQVRSFYLQDSEGNVIQQVKVNEQVDISIVARNYQKVDQQYVIVAQICDNKSLATAILYSLGNVKDADAADLSISWTPEAAGSYNIKIMIWDELSSPSLLSESVQKVITVSSS